MVIVMEIKEGSLVRYNGTGTVGVVKLIKEEDGETWALLDSTELYYLTSYLEPIEKVPERKELGGMSLEDLAERMKEEKELMERARLHDENLECGG